MRYEGDGKTVPVDEGDEYIYIYIVRLKLAFVLIFFLLLHIKFNGMYVVHARSIRRRIILFLLVEKAHEITLLHRPNTAMT